MWAGGSSYGQIAAALGVHRTSVSREVARNHVDKQGAKNPRGGMRDRGLLGGVRCGRPPVRRPAGPAGPRTGYQVGYRAVRAQQRAQARQRRPKPHKLVSSASHPAGGVVREAVVRLLRDRLSPQQVSAQLRLDYPDRPELRVSHETIYQALYVQGRASLRELVDDSLRVKRRQRRSQSRAAQAARGAIKGRPWVTEEVYICARPAEVTDRAVPGHWEGDLLIGARGGSAIVTLAERTTRFVMLGALPNDRTSPEVIAVIRGLFARLPQALRRSLTWDQGVELAGYATFGLVEDCAVFFCDPHSPWQRGTNENTNGLLRDYFPKGRSLAGITQADLDAVADQLNRRPRQTLGWHTPAQQLNKHLRALTA
jgi:transposase, IS30 family